MKSYNGVYFHGSAASEACGVEEVQSNGRVSGADRAADDANAQALGKSVPHLVISHFQKRQNGPITTKIKIALNRVGF